MRAQFSPMNKSDKAAHNRTSLENFIRAAAAMLMLSAPSLSQAQAPPAKIDIDLTPVAKVSPLHYGLMTEEINHCYDGGLYAELVQNRVFKDNAQNPVHWSTVLATAAAATIALDNARPLNPILDTSLRLDVTAASGTA